MEWMAEPMASASGGSKLYRPFTPLGAWSGRPKWGSGRRGQVTGLALAMFIALFGWGASYFGWYDPQGKIQLALFTTFILGVICGYKNKG